MTVMWNLLACSRDMEYNRECSKHSHLLIPQATCSSKRGITVTQALPSTCKHAVASANMSMSKGVGNVEMSSPICLLAFAVCRSPQNCRSTQHLAWRTMSLGRTCDCQIDVMLKFCNPWSTVQMGLAE